MNEPPTAGQATFHGWYVLESNSFGSARGTGSRAMVCWFHLGPEGMGDMPRIASCGAVLALALSSSVASAQLMIPDSGTGDRVMLFSAFDGSLIDANWLTDAGQPFAFTTPKEAAVVGNEIWVSDQLADAIHRFDLNRTYVGSITAHPNGGVLDNLRGFGYDGTNVYLTVDPSVAANGGIVRINAATATPDGFFFSSASLFDAQPFGGTDLLVSNTTNDQIERYRKSDGALLAPFASGLDFPQQVAQMPDGSIVTLATIASETTEGVYHYNADGTLRRFIDTEPLKLQFGQQVPTGAWVLGNGDYLISTGIGIFTYNVAGNSFAQVLGGVSGQYINPIPEPAAVGLIGLGALAAMRRRRVA